MKRFACVVFVLGVILVNGMTGPCLALDFSAQTGVCYSFWDSDEDDDGSQLFIPVRLNASRKDVSFHLQTAYANSAANRDRGVDESVSAVTDTKLGASYMIQDRLPVDILLGLDANLPTGKTGVRDDLRIALRDPDLYAITRLGEGFNLNPTLIVAKSWEHFRAGVGAGYAWRGEYDYSESIEQYDPGDIFNVVVEVNYDFTPWLGVRFFAEKAWYKDNERAGEAVSKTGDFMMFGLDFDYTRAQWEARLSASAVFRDKSKYTDAGGDLVTEARAGYGDEWSARFEARYHFSEKNSVGAAATYLTIEENDYASTSAYYFGGRNKYALSLGYSHAFDHGFSADIVVERFRIDDDATWAHPGEDRAYTGHGLSLLLTKAF